MLRTQTAKIVMVCCLVLTASSSVWATPPVGTWQVGVLTVDFPNLTGPATIGSPPLAARTYYENLLFGDHPSNAPNGSLKDYYTEVSYNQLTMTGQVNTGTTNWYRLPQASTAYGDGNGGNITQILIDAVAAANSAGFDFGPLDNDNDGYVDAIFVVRPDGGRAYASSLNIPTGDVNALGNPVYTGRFSVIFGSTTIGIFAHEFGHNLGLPDLYDTDESSEGLGRWSLMAYGNYNGSPSGALPAHPDAWSKVALGWVTPVVPTTSVSLNLPPVETNQSIYKLRTPSREYFLLENRYLSGFDAALPYLGLLLYHVDDAIAGNSQEFYPGCTICTSHYKVAVEQADGLFELEQYNGYGNTSDSGDPYPISGNTAFTAASTPNSTTYAGADSGVSITGITRSGTNITASVAGPPSGLDFPIMQADNAQSAPRVAFGGTDYMAVWKDARTTLNDIYAARVSQAGVLLDPAGILIGNGLSLDIAFDGTNYLIVWSQNGSVVGKRVSSSGVVLDPTPITLGTGYSPRLAFDGTNYFVVWTEYQAGTSADVFGARVAPSGTVLDPGGIALVAASGDQFLPQIAYGGGQYFVVWVSGSSWFGSRVTPSGTVLDPAGIALNPVGNAAAVAYQGAGFLTVWAESGHIKGVRVSSSGVLLDATPISISTSTAGIQSYPAVAYNGSNNIVVWDDSTAGIQGTFVAPSGTVLNPTPTTFSMSNGEVESPAVSSDPIGLAVWADWRNQPAAASCTLPACNVDIYGNFVQQGPPVLLSQGQPATASSSYSTNTPDKAVDGITTNFWNSGGYAPRWIYVDLGSVRSITEVRVLAGTGSPSGTTYYNVDVSNNATNWTTVTSASNASATVYTVSPVSASARYVRIYVTSHSGGSWIALREFQVYGNSGGGGGSYSLTVSKSGTGSGTVTSSPAGINCGATCSASYTSGTVVTLTATPAGGSTFGGWSGAGCSGTGTCVVTMNAAQNVTATFTLQSYTLTVSKTGTGSGTVTSSPAGINCGATCSASYTSGTVVTLTATPAGGSTFGGWSGAGCSGTGTCVVTMNAAQTVTATFNDSGGQPVLLSQGQPATASSSYSTATPDKAVDGNTSTLWNSGGYAPRWIYVDLGSARSITEVRVLAGTGSPSGTTYYNIDVSADATNWTTVTSASNASATTYTVSSVSANARYVRIYVTSHSGGSWIALREFQVYGF